MMRREVEYGLWLLVEQEGGDVAVVLGDMVLAPRDLSHGKLKRALRDFCDREPVRCEARLGYCARYSAPGYMDATDWCGPYTTEAEAIEECERLYGEDDVQECQDDGDDTEGAL